MRRPCISGKRQQLPGYFQPHLLGLVNACTVGFKNKVFKLPSPSSAFRLSMCARGVFLITLKRGREHVDPSTLWSNERDKQLVFLSHFSNGLLRTDIVSRYYSRIFSPLVKAPADSRRFNIKNVRNLHLEIDGNHCGFYRFYPCIFPLLAIHILYRDTSLRFSLTAISDFIQDPANGNVFHKLTAHTDVHSRA